MVPTSRLVVDCHGTDVLGLADPPTACRHERSHLGLRGFVLCRMRVCRAMRTEACVCGGLIHAYGDVARAVAEHNLTLSHLVWRHCSGIDDPRRRWPTADDKPVDMRQGDVSASADGVEGIA